MGVSGWPRAALGRGGCQEAGAETEPRVRESLGRAESVQWGQGEEKRKDLGERDSSGLGEGDRHEPGRGTGLGGREWSPGAGGKSVLMPTPAERRGWAQGGQCPSIRRAASSFLLRKQDGSHCVAVCGCGGPRRPPPQRPFTWAAGVPSSGGHKPGRDMCISEVFSGGRRHAMGWESLATFYPRGSPVGGWGISGQCGGRGGEGAVIDRQWSSELPRVSSQTEGRVLGSRVWMKGALSQGPSGV